MKQNQGAARRWGALHLTSILLVLALLAGCVPIQPPADAPAAAPQPTAAPADAAQADPLAGAWEGSLAVAGIELAIRLDVTSTADGYSATLDIPQQSALGLPVGNLEVTLPQVRFTILEGAQQAAFDGTLDEQRVLSGTFTQGGQEGTFSLARADANAAEAAPVLAEPAAQAAPAAEGSGISYVYTDTAGLFSVPVPTGWTLTEDAGFVTLTDPEGAILVNLLAVPGEDPAAAIESAWQSVQPGFDLEVKQRVEPPAGNGIEQIVVLAYDTGSDEEFVQAAGLQFQGNTYVELFRIPLEAVQRRSAQVSIVDSGFTILGQKQDDLSDVPPLPFDDAIAAAWEPFIERALADFQIPGAAIGVVQGGELVYAKGFGYADPATQTPMTPQTHMLIGSTSKSFATMLMGILVDEGLMTWDTPAQALYPDFAVLDPALSESITMRNLVCACTGVPRRDFELLFNAHELDATDIISSLRTFEFFTDFGEAFQYSNQMVATGGYIAGHLAKPEAPTLEEAFATALQERVLGPIGMEQTTFSFEDVIAAGDSAQPYGMRLDGGYEPIPLETEETLLPVIPAAGLWSTLEDMARYMQTQLALGVAPDGTRVISEENLLETRKPQVKINAEESYGLGWMVGNYKEVPVVAHGGNMLGFTSEFAFLPTADTGLVILANAQGANYFTAAVRQRLLELLFAQEDRATQMTDFYLQQLADQREKLSKQMAGPVDPDAVAPFLGDFASPALGGLTLLLDEGRLFADVGEFRMELLPINDEDGKPHGYIAVSPPLPGVTVQLERSDKGAPQVVMGQGLTEYTFTPAQ